VVIRDAEIKQAVRASFESANQTAKPVFNRAGRSEYAKLKLEGITDAPVNLAVFYHPSEGPVLGQTTVEETGLYSVVCAVQNMWLMARALNIGMGWVSILDPSEVKRLLNAPPQCQLVAYMCVGYVSDFGDTPELEQIGWETRKRRAEVVHQDRFRVERSSAVEEC
jgi:5,6-dimethylbenzimidazole synthase